MNSLTKLSQRDAAPGRQAEAMRAAEARAQQIWLRRIVDRSRKEEQRSVRRSGPEGSGNCTRTAFRPETDIRPGGLTPGRLGVHEGPYSRGVVDRAMQGRRAPLRTRQGRVAA